MKFANQIIDQLAFEDITKEQYEIPLSILIGSPSTNTEFRIYSKGLNTTVKNILLREGISTIFELGTYNINELLNIQLISFGRVKTIFDFYSTLVITEDKSANQLRTYLRQLINEHSLSNTLDMIFAEFLPNSELTIRGIDKEKGICGGKARVAYTRIPVWTLVSFKNQGITDLELLKLYPQLTSTDLTIAFAYAAIHREEIAKDIFDAEND
jgi:uncharacterized protein (DUF433 family)